MTIINRITKWHLLIFAMLLFVTCFYVINLKFDRFYRVSGINNENRVLIERYLSEEDQEYLIENRIPVNRFIDYIKYDDFKIQNYRYYNLLLDTGRYESRKKIIKYGNILKDRLYKEFSRNYIDYGTVLVNQKVELGYIKKKAFRYAYTDYYASVVDLYDNTGYVEDINDLVEAYHNRDVINTEDLKRIISNIGMSYDREGIKLIIKKAADQDIDLVDYPSSLSTVVNANNYIANYVPKNLVLITDIKRFEYSMYLNTECYNQLLALKAGMGDLGDGLFVRRAYLSYDYTSKNDKAKAGYNEYQLATTVDLSQSGLNYNDFSTSNLSHWLEENAYKYGFVLRYPHKKASVTNHEYSSHTYRYVGVDIALEMYENDLSLEEYQARRRFR